MLDPNDLKQIRNVVKEEVDASSGALRKEIKESGTALRAEMKGMETSLREEIKGMGTSLREEIKESANNLREEFKADLQASENRIILEVGNFITDTILPQIDDKADKRDINSLDRKIDNLSGEVIEHDQEIKDIKVFIGMPAK